MSVEEGLVAQLLADGPVAAIIGTKVFPGSIPQLQDAPAVVYNRVSSQRDVELAGATSLIAARLRVDCWAPSYEGSRALSDAVRTALQNTGIGGELLGSQAVQMVYLETEGDLSNFDGDRRDYRVSQDWIIIYEEI